MKKRSGVLSFLLVLFVLLFAVGCSQNLSEDTGNLGMFHPGTYEGKTEGYKGPITISVTVEENSIKSIEVVRHRETNGVAEAALKQIPSSIVENQSLMIDTISGATYTSRAIIGATKEALLAAGANIKDITKTVEAKEKFIELRADVVVIGTGGAGTAAAVTAAENGAKVIVLEKTAVSGGTTASGFGFFAADSAKAKEIGHEPIDTDRVYQLWMEEMNHQCDAELVKQFLDLSHTTTDWLEAHGLIFHKSAEATCECHGAGINGYHKYDDSTKTSSQLGAMLEKIVEDYRANVFYETPATELITNNGAVTGVIAKAKDATKVKILADSVIIASGGFLGHAEVLKFALNEATVNPAGFNSNVGDGIKMADEAGAVRRGMEAIVSHTFKVDGSDKIKGDYEFMELYRATHSVAYVPVIPWLNANGERFTNEDIIYDRELSTNALIEQGEFSWFLYNKALLQTLEEKGARAAGMRDKIVVGPMPEIAPMDRGWSNLTEIVGMMVEAGYVVQADTLEELAAKTDMDRMKLADTIERYNQDTAIGVDTSFGKDKSHMYPMNEGPYYAFKVTANKQRIIGGLHINSDFQVLQYHTEKGLTPIKNLYAAGADATGIYSGSYSHIIEGAAQGWAYNSGRLAGAKATENALGDKVELQ